MHFGRVNNPSEQNLALPPDAPRTTKFLSLLRSFETKVYIGCPIWAVPSWLGTLYPKGTKRNDFLRVYASHFSTVEVNSTFYQLLDGERLARWREQVPAEFRFCPKVYRGITEQLAAEELPTLVQTFCSAVRAFESNLGLVFAQLPESVGPKQGALLNRLISFWPKDIPLAIEFRHPGWFTEHALLDEAVNHLYRNNITAVITDTAGRRDALHLSLTQPKVLIRFQGNSLHPSDAKRLYEWAARLRSWSQQHLEEIYFFAHQPEEASIPQTATMLMKEWANLTV